MKRYIVVIDAYVYAEDNKEAIQKAQALAKELDDKHDNKAKVIELHQNDFGSIQSHKISLT